jgi:2-polyprenyl-3-methyl-5-hydroxy-6-metoxy-1,4-benzoquinol methylase
VSREAERTRYDEHHNTLSDQSYVDYCRGVAALLHTIPLVDPSVLDFGCGQHQVLARLLAREGIRCRAYDPLYGIGMPALEGTYDVVIMCECIEHLRGLAAEVRRVMRLLVPSGYLIVRTELLADLQNFASWWYIRDCTHINFFSLTAMRYVAERIAKPLCFTNNKNVCIFGNESLPDSKSVVRNPPQ